MIPELAQLLKKSIEQSLEDKVAIAFSGGVDSSLIAHVARENCEAGLFTCGTPISEDLIYAERVASALKLPLHKHIFEDSQILEIYEKCQKICPGDLLKVELLVPVYKVCEMAKEKGFTTMLFGSASEELFVGYERYYNYFAEGKDLDNILKDEYKSLKSRDMNATEKVCRYLGVKARFPFYNKELADFVFAVPLELRMEDRELKKGLIREASKLLGLTEIAINRKKRAMQYGSGIHKVLLRHSRSF